MDRLTGRTCRLSCAVPESRTGTGRLPEATQLTENKITFQKVVAPSSGTSCLGRGRFHSLRVFEQKLVLGHFFLSMLTKTTCPPPLPLTSKICVSRGETMEAEKKTCSVITEREHVAKWCALNSDESRKCSL